MTDPAPRSWTRRRWTSAGCSSVVALALVLVVLAGRHATAAAAAATAPAGAPEAAATTTVAAAADGTPDAALAEAIERAGDNGRELVRALATAPRAHRPGMAFLIRHAPESDLRTLTADFLREHVAAMHRGRDAVPWGASIPEHLFHNDVLPYASVNEPREAWHRELQPLALEIVTEAGATTPGEAAMALNRELFTRLGVKYSTKRKRPDQAPSETIEQGMATCSGLSILLVDACRAVSVPARLAGVASWSDDRGNHTWVEVWDDGWKFAGAAEPDAKGLDRGWFVGDARRAVAGHPRYAVMATSWAPADRHWPLVWAPRNRTVPGIDVTRRYAAPGDEAAGDPTTVRLMVTVDGPDGERLPTRVGIRAVDASTWTHTIETRGPEADRFDHAAVEVAPGAVYEVAVLAGGGPRARVDLTLAEPGRSHVVELELSGAAAELADAAAAADADLADPGLADPDARGRITLPAPAAIEPAELDVDTEAALRAWFADYFAADAERQATLARGTTPFDALLVTPAGDAAVRAIAWEVYRAAPIHDDVHANMAANRVRTDTHESPFVLKEVGTKPDGGWPLVIAMHGGGGVPKHVNDQQWRHMQIYYRDQPDAGGYLYLALRAPTDEWNGFYTGYTYPLIEALIHQVAVTRDVDTDRVYAIGYSHGGYGAFAIGPTIPYRFGAVHASAAAPTPGQGSFKNLLALRFTAMCGERDTAYGRIERCREFGAAVAALRGARTDAFDVHFIEIAGRGHGGLPDRDWVAELLPHTRNPVPRELWWEQTTDLVPRFYWLADASPATGRTIRATCRENTVRVDATDAQALGLRLDARLIDPARPLVVDGFGPTRRLRVSPSIGTFAASLAATRDPHLACTIAVDLGLDDPPLDP